MKKKDKYYSNNAKMKKYSQVLTILCTIFCVIIVGLIAYMIYVLYDNYTADISAEELMSQFEENYTQEEPEQENPEQPTNEEDNNQTTTNETTNNKPNTSYNIGTYYKGYKIIGIINIPKINIQYPIFNVDNSATLRVGTAAIYPLNSTTVEYALNKPGNVVIAGHNYKSGRMFAKLYTLKNGDSIYITNITGEKLEYKVYNNYTADEDDFTYATRDTGGLTEISLTTCTSNSKTRTIIWAKAEI